MPTATVATDVEASSAVSVAAADSTTMVVIAGAGAYSGSGTAIGASVSTTEVSNTIQASIDGAKVDSTGAGVNVLAGFSPSGSDVDLAGLGLIPLSCLLILTSVHRLSMSPLLVLTRIPLPLAPPFP